MSTQRRTGILMGVIAIVVVAMACALPLAAPQAGRPTETPTATAQAVLPANGSGSGTGSSAGGGAGGSGSGSGNSGSGADSSNQSSSEPTPEPTPLADVIGGPYTVKQIETLGGEAVSGTVCNIAKPFSVLSVTPHVTFSFNFVPQDTKHGKVTYAYSIKSAGEAHNAAGTYTLARLDKVGTLQLSLTVSDHVSFKGFDGNIPNRYKFNLVPSGGPPCPAAP